MTVPLEDLAKNLESLQGALGGLAKLLADREGTESARSQIEWSASHLFMAIRELRGEFGPVDQVRKLPAESLEGGLMEGLRGHTRAITIPEVLGFIASLRKSGVLRINSPDEAYMIQLETGSVVYAQGDNPPPGSRLGEILVTEGALSQEALDEFTDGAGGEPGMLGSQLIARGLVSEEAMRIALCFQVQLLFHRVFEAKDSVFQFDEGQQLRNPGDIRLDVTSLLLESARSSDESAASDELRKSA